MIIIDRALERRRREGRPINVAMVGAGFMGRGIALQFATAATGMRLVAIANRRLGPARRAYAEAGAPKPRPVDTPAELRLAIVEGCPAITEDWKLLCEAPDIDAIIEVTGSIDYAAAVACAAIEHGKHIIMMNAELDGTVGPLLKRRADAAGVVFTNTDGDQPGVTMNLFRFVRGIGVRPVLCGSIKGLHDPYRNPTTQIEFAKKWGQKPHMVASFADGTKISFEQAIVANATGIRVGRRGMFGPTVENGTPLEEAAHLLPALDFADGEGIVDYVVGAVPAPGVFVLGTIENPVQRHYLALYKLGRGPLYLFYTPYHLCHLEVPNTVARAVLFGDAAIAPAGAPRVDVVTTAKIDLEEGVTLDEMGHYMTYGQAENADVARRERLLPLGLAAGCRLKRRVPRDDVLSYDDVEIPPGRLIDRLRAEQDAMFGEGSTPPWVERVVAFAASDGQGVPQMTVEPERARHGRGELGGDGPADVERGRPSVRRAQAGQMIGHEADAAPGHQAADEHPMVLPQVPALQRVEFVGGEVARTELPEQRQPFAHQRLVGSGDGRRHRAFVGAREGQDFVDEPELGAVEEVEMGGHVRVQVGGWIERPPRPHEIGTDEARGRREAEDLAAQEHSRDLGAGIDLSVLRQSAALDVISSQPQRADDPNAGIALGEPDHFSQAIGIEEVVRVEDFAVRAFARDIFDRPVPVLDHGDRRVVGVDADTRIAARVALGDLAGAVGAGVVEDDVLEVRVALPENAVDAFREVGGGVVGRGDDADQGLLRHPRLSLVGDRLGGRGVPSTDVAAARLFSTGARRPRRGGPVRSGRSQAQRLSRRKPFVVGSRPRHRVVPGENGKRRQPVPSRPGEGCPLFRHQRDRDAPRRALPAAPRRAAQGRRRRGLAGGGRVPHRHDFNNDGRRATALAGRERVMKVVILAGGYGTRISEESTIRPKPLVEIGGRPILWHIMKIYSAHGLNEFVVCCGYKGDMIKNYFRDYIVSMSDVTFDLRGNRMELHRNGVEPWRVTLVDTGEKTMTGGRVKRVRKYVGEETFCLTYGDGVANLDVTGLIESHRRSDALATVTAVREPGRFGALSLMPESNRVLGFREKANEDGGYINGGFFVLEPGVHDYIEGDDTIWERDPMGRLAEEGRLNAYRHRGFWQSMDTLRDRNVLEGLWQSGDAPWKIW
jgi:glucose-1-phosphate cytidylyltransferase